MKSRKWNKLIRDKRGRDSFEKTRQSASSDATLARCALNASRGRPKNFAPLSAILKLYPGRENRLPQAFLSRLGRVCLLFSCFIFLLGGCSQAGGNRTALEYMPDMADQPSFKAQKADPWSPHDRSMRMPVAGTIPRGYQPYEYKEDPEGAARNLKNPFTPTKEVLLAGQKGYNINCAVCHGAKGLGDGPIVPKFPKPPSLQSDKVRGWTDGHIYHVITMGQNLMPSYASQIAPAARWGIIHYMRALQLAQAPAETDVEAYKKSREKK